MPAALWAVGRAIMLEPPPMLMTPVPRGLATHARFVPASMPPRRLSVPASWTPTTAPAVPMTSGPPREEAAPARPRRAPW